MSWVSLLFSALIMHIREDDGKVEDITLDKFETTNRKHYWIFSAQDCSKRIILALKMLFSKQALLKSRGAYIDTQNYPDCIMDFIIMFMSSRRPENILGSSHLALGRRKQLYESQSRLSRLPKTNFLKCKNGLHIVFLSSRWSKTNLLQPFYLLLQPPCCLSLDPWPKMAS